jgi:hypothetical protein
MAYLAAGKGRTAAMFTLFCPRRDNIMSMQVGKQVVFLGIPMNFDGGAGGEVLVPGPAP